MPRSLLVFLVPLLVPGLFPAAVAQTLALEADKPFVPDGRPLQGLTITIDPAGGGAGYGAEHAGGASAALADDLNMLVAGHLQHHLRRAGAVVHLTRWDDRQVALGDADAATVDDGAPDGETDTVIDAIADVDVHVDVDVVVDAEIELDAAAGSEPAAGG